MKKIYVSALVLSLVSSAQLFGQGIQTDSVQMGAGYANQVFYDMKTGVKGTATIANWDIAHSSDARSSCIRANHMTGLMVFSYPNNTNAGWATFDTSGWENWRQRYNDIHDHDKGAFSLTAIHPDYDWGSYNSSTHEITGDSLFLLAWSNGVDYVKFLKFWPVKQTVTSDLIIRYADVDGSNEVVDTLHQSKANGQNYKYYSFNKTQPVREPVNTSWDINFNRYYEPIPAGPTIVMYPVMGVESNRLGVQVAKIHGPDYMTVLADTNNLISKYGAAANNDLTAIGSNWKTFDNNSFQWFLSDTSSYLVKSEHMGDTSWWMIHFTAFSGSSSGKSVFNKMKLTNSASITQPGLGTVTVFPNPASGQVFVALENNITGQAQIQLIQLNGTIIQSQNVSPNSGFESFSLPIQNLPAGIYVVSVTSGNQKIQQKIVIQ